MDRAQMLEQLSRIERTAEENIIKDGYLLPAFLIFHGDTTTAIGLDPSGIAHDFYKEEACDFVRLKLMELKADAYAFISESWITQHDIDAPPEQRERPSKDPNRREVVFITIETPDRMFASSREIIRDGDGSVIGLKPNDIDLVEGKSFGGRFTNLFTEAVN